MNKSIKKNYWKNVINAPHGIMFHHFHDNKIHKSSQGSITKDDLYKIIKFVGRNNILNADDFLIRACENKLKPKNLCLTFDDGIKSQYDVALPVLEDLNIKSFFFIYSSIFTSKPNPLEIFRFFRMNYFEDVNEFYKSFYEVLDEELVDFFNNNKKYMLLIKKRFPHYSMADLKFRFVRDIFLKEAKYNKVMFKMFKKFKYFPKRPYKELFFDKKILKKINSLGHVVGLHSHWHPTEIDKLSYNLQKKEYLLNINTLSKILKVKKHQIKSVSHPCGKYNNHTLKILKELNIKLGFKSHLQIDKYLGINKINNSLLEIGRKDHSEIFRIIMN
jgi:peptidoglycan/xylan/chitin deacetylase (PgdA/CDA1 family)